MNIYIPKLAYIAIIDTEMLSGIMQICSHVITAVSGTTINMHFPHSEFHSPTLLSHLMDS